MHGQVALVLPVRRHTGENCTLKVSWPDEETRHEPAALQAWAGHGAVLLLAVDHRRGAMLLERLDSSMTLQEQPIARALDVAASVLRELHVPAPAGLPTTTATAERWHHTLAHEWRRLGEPGPARLIDAATMTCGHLSHDPTPPVLLHGDFHFANVLAGTRQPWNAIDPKPLTGNPEYDLLPLLRNRWDDITASPQPAQAVRQRIDTLVEATGLDRTKAHAWAFIRSVDDALWGHAQHDTQFEAIAWEIAHALST
ncbi:aminoglycoside phosphotransferase family protein [Pseudofrankia sp. EUN1h]|uniref:aminoglycoside phosphotransferase family protein n=2 Tax=Pseudofrankia TaxID=2994363 RepID=UPI001F527817|nr:aminoglycoside phosphotransferase family protein [Pseudofrankia sp. EUN1h]